MGQLPHSTYEAGGSFGPTSVGSCRPSSSMVSYFHLIGFSLKMKWLWFSGLKNGGSQFLFKFLLKLSMNMVDVKPDINFFVRYVLIYIQTFPIIISTAESIWQQQPICIIHSFTTYLSTDWTSSCQYYKYNLSIEYWFIGNSRTVISLTILYYQYFFNYFIMNILALVYIQTTMC